MNSPADLLVVGRIKPPLGPRKVLCVVVVTTSAYGSGFGYTAGDQPGEMRHVNHHVGADRIGDRAKPGEVYDTGIGATRR